MSKFRMSLDNLKALEAVRVRIAGPSTNEPIKPVKVPKTIIVKEEIAVAEQVIIRRPVNRQAARMMRHTTDWTMRPDNGVELSRLYVGR